MKTRIFIITLLFLFGSWCDGLATQPLYVFGRVEDSLHVEGHNAFLFIQYDNQAEIIDTCIVRQGKFAFSGILPYDDINAEVLIEGVPASSGRILVNRGDTVRFAFHPLGKFGRPEVIGSRSHEELYHTMFGPEIQPKYRLAAKLRSLVASDPEYETVKDSLAYYQTLHRTLYTEMLHRTKSCHNAIFAYFYLQSELSESEQQQIERHIKSTFANNVNISMLTGTTSSGTPIAETSLESKKAFNSYALILGDVPPFSEIIGNADSIAVAAPHSDEEVIVIKRPSQTANNRQDRAYVIGDIVADFALPSIEESNNVHLYDLQSDYILIDFWASWCGPCREEIPALLSAVRDYEGTLSVYAVSIDENLNRWKHAVEADGSGTALTHVILRKNNADYDRLFRLFGIETIPHNFLLDADRRIVAIDLRGEALRTKMEELQRK